MTTYDIPPVGPVPVLPPEGWIMPDNTVVEIDPALKEKWTHDHWTFTKDPSKAVPVQVREDMLVEWNRIATMKGQPAAQQMVAITPHKIGGCPDTGKCHHWCANGPCWRVRSAGPLSGVFPDDRWPKEVVEANGVAWVPRNAAEAIDSMESIGGWNHHVAEALRELELRLGVTYVPVARKDES